MFRTLKFILFMLALAMPSVGMAQQVSVPRDTSKTACVMLFWRGGEAKASLTPRENCPDQNRGPTPSNNRSGVSRPNRPSGQMGGAPPSGVTVVTPPAASGASVDKPDSVTFYLVEMNEKLTKLLDLSEDSNASLKRIDANTALILGELAKILASSSSNVSTTNTTWWGRRSDTQKVLLGVATAGAVACMFFCRVIVNVDQINNP